MQFTIATIAAMAAAASATVIPRSDLGAWNVTITSSFPNTVHRSETVSGVYANSELADNIPVNCHFQGQLNDEIINKLTCTPESFSYTFESAGYGDNGYLYQLTLSQTVSIANTNVTVKGVSDKFYRTCDSVTGKFCTASGIIVNVNSAVA
ncbi:hypothetical protein C7974DRAFT_419942 [Boeremia exigua]|uniref:uncharacterized protein n=1 Tax=Boeremia exigua TaxID=749465 RepID=UPI001E8EE6C7|nr:uncharacterized protein C7974DRAFT_419942 [Boeremia exigua]KAH6644456.1 hypothetical protein C7974DRAFT_419942 [Boeremia exigua]